MFLNRALQFFALILMGLSMTTTVMAKGCNCAHHKKKNTEEATTQQQLPHSEETDHDHAGHAHDAPVDQE